MIASQNQPRPIHGVCGRFQGVWDGGWRCRPNGLDGSGGGLPPFERLNREAFSAAVSRGSRGEGPLHDAAEVCLRVRGSVRL